MKKKLNGFTLAEVLITLTIIGVIAAITVPTLIQKTNKQEYVTALQKAYSTLSQAVNMIIAEEGSPKSSCETCNDGWAYSSNSAYEHLKKHLSSLKECPNNGGCFTKPYKNINKGSGLSIYSGWAGSSFKTADGASIFISNDPGWRSSVCSKSLFGVSNTCLLFFVDINGNEKGPNIQGRDYFLFGLTEDGIYPVDCGYNSSNCRAKLYGDSTGAGTACGCSVLRESAMNY